MRVRADQVRAGQRISGAMVTKVRQTLERGTVRLTLENDYDPRTLSRSTVGVADGTFCYRSGDILDVESPRT
ncbi:MAG TPA: hypothetical protein VNP20_10520 [Nocardioidaceae bacterium]|nr:hypothetical protein [Nocardioidaceae bacterium]